jgi:uncharacterized protein (DUF433 family)
MRVVGVKTGNARRRGVLSKKTRNPDGQRPGGEDHKARHSSRHGHFTGMEEAEPERSGTAQLRQIEACNSGPSRPFSDMSELLERITINPDRCGGRPCIRGMRIRVTDVLDLLAAGLSAERILDEMPDLEPDDIRASVAYASRLVDHPVLAA